MSSVHDTRPEHDPTSGDSPVTSSTPPASALSRLRAQLFSSTSPLWIFLALVVIVAVFGIMKPSSFLSSFDIKTIFINASVALMLSVTTRSACCGVSVEVAVLLTRFTSNSSTWLTDAVSVVGPLLTTVATIFRVWVEPVVTVPTDQMPLPPS